MNSSGQGGHNSLLAAIFLEDKGNTARGYKDDFSAQSGQFLPGI
jgi:hypothetical protein